MTIIHWFRRDLRLHDNPGLLYALRHAQGRVVPLFVIDDAILRAPDTGPARVAFMLDSLRALDQALRARGSRLVVRRGPAVAALTAIAREAVATAVTWNRDYTPYATRRDQRARAALAGIGVASHDFKDAVILELDEVRTGQGGTYTVFTPYRRTWRAVVDQRLSQILAEPALTSFAPVPEQLASDEIPSPSALGLSIDQELPPGGEASGLAALDRFIVHSGQHGIAEYASGRDQLAAPGTSRLSAYLRMGCLAPIAALRAALRALGDPDDSARGVSVETWISELAWRDFYYQIMAAFPHVLRSAFRPQYDAIAWENSPAWFEAWCQGRTGFPVVDAAMRQLRAEGWMHNRARMIVASFLTKDLLIDWRWGERFFMQQLVDGDHASNNGGWQWAAGTGTDAQPYFRIFNPTSQGQKFDPHGDYVRRYVPELAAVPARAIHTPWDLPQAELRHGGALSLRDYPRPIVDHATQRRRALEIYGRAATHAR